MLHYLLSCLALLLATFVEAATFPAAINNHVIQPAFSASVTSGVAPLVVHFSAKGTTNPETTNNPFHDLEYKWDFGDSGAGTWSYGATSTPKNIEYGPVTAHVFDTPGIYTVTLSVYNGSVTKSYAHTITVTDPNVVFSGNTICVTASGSSFVGCPTIPSVYADSAACVAATAALGASPGDKCITQSSFNTAVTTYATAGKRLLFKRGDTFTNTVANLTPVGNNGHIGAFGSGAKPVVSDSTNNNILSVTNSIRDWRITDLDFNSGTQVTGRFATLDGGAAFSHLLFYRNVIRGGSRGITVSGDGWPRYNDVLAIVDNTFSDEFYSADGTGSAAYVSGDRLVYMGNNIEGTRSHNTRFPGLSLAVLSHNTHRKDSVANALSQQAYSACIRIHATSFVTSTATFVSGQSTVSALTNMVDIEGRVVRGAATIYGASVVGGTAFLGNIDPVARTATMYSSLALSTPVVANASNTVAVTMNIWGGNYTEDVVVAENHCISDGAGDAPIEIEPQDGHTDERVRNIIVERNLTTALPGAGGSHVPVRVSGDNISIRNNIFNLSGSLNVVNAVMVRRYGVSYPVREPNPTRIFIYNNTVYNDRIIEGTPYDGTPRMFYIGEGPTPADPVKLKNNLGYQADSGSTGIMVYDYNVSVLAGPATVEEAGNSTLTEFRNTNPFSVTSPSAVSDFNLTPGSYADTRGVSVPGVYIDFNRVRRTTNRIGAIGP